MDEKRANRTSECGSIWLAGRTPSSGQYPTALTEALSQPIVERRAAYPAPARCVPFTAGHGFLTRLITSGIRRTVSSRGLSGHLLFNWLAG